MILPHASKIYVVDSSIYHYFRNPDTVEIEQQRPERCHYTFDLIKVLDKIYEYYHKNNLLDNYGFWPISWALAEHSYIVNQEYYIQIKNFFHKISHDILSHPFLYRDDELQYIKDVLSLKTHKMLIEKRVPYQKSVCKSYINKSKIELLRNYVKCNIQIYK
jgi:hypothetical protein